MKGKSCAKAVKEMAKSKDKKMIKHEKKEKKLIQKEKGTVNKLEKMHKNY